jgi:hypothetical protein
MALTAVDGRRTLVIEGTLSRADEAVLRRGLSWATLDDIVPLERLPMDGRHASKVNYPALERVLAGRARVTRPTS